MSQSDRQEEDRTSNIREPLVWDRVEWRQGDGRYVFQVASGGLLATFTPPHGPALTLPIVAWEGLLDALAAARKTRSRGERRTPARASVRWSYAESDELAAAFKAGRSIAQLAAIHNRTRLAIEAQLARLGLWDPVARRPIGRGPIGEAPAAPAPPPAAGGCFP